ncbi:major facilitator super transporter protein [Coemansia sp. RSA 2704]|nr:major facilitator super transporter protein [Coemansia sp. RSA 2704]
MGHDSGDERSRRRARHGSRSPSRRSRQESLSPESRKDRRHRDKESRSRRRSDSREERRRKKSTSSRHKSRKDKHSGDEVGGYRNANNPFNDASLGKKFVWKKKVEQDRAKGLSREERELAERQRREEAEQELENLRKRRELREIEREQREQEFARQRREQEQEKLGDWERREEEFHLQQAKRRAEIRIQNQRAQPIDTLAMNLRLANEKMSDEEVAAMGNARIDVDEPHQIVECLDVVSARELLHDIDMYLSLETNARNVEFWENMLVVANAHLERLSGKGGMQGAVRDVLAGKSLDELDELEADVQAKLGGEQGAVDVDYWEQVRSELVVEKAKATLTVMHEDILQRRLARLQQSKDAPAAAAGAPGRTTSEVEQRKRQRLEELQRRILQQQPAPEDRAIDGQERDMSQEMFEAEMRKDHDPSEAIFSVEAAVGTRKYAWQDKHRPRKPRYFNRVHTGYEWNKYNQTHYDKDNPPPKVVQGYKFNIFYPDLIDRTSAPTYRIEKDPESDETSILRFVAGPPYEDVAFRIVNREWEYNRRRGFRNTFDRGVLQLHFRFKRHRLLAAGMELGQPRRVRWMYAGALTFLLLMELVGLGLFAKGFFPYKKTIPGFASRADQPISMGRGLSVPPAQYDRLVLMVVDALRNDFVFSNESAMAYTQDLLRSGQALGFTAKAQAPTVTMPRIKALMTGTVPNFLDAVLNIAESDTSSSLQYQDNLLWQLKTHGNKSINMFGDDTWLRLFPGMFARADGTSSFFVTDTVEVDNNVTRNVRPELERDDWGVTVLHYLGLDHIGHLAGPKSPLMKPKQREMDDVVRTIHDIVSKQDQRRIQQDKRAKPTLFVVLGDHAMNEIGNHGGNSKLETSTVFVFIGSTTKSQPMADRGRNALSKLMATEVPQSNLVPTLALLLGVPIPKNSLGLPLPELLSAYTDRDRLHMLQTAAAQIYNVVRTSEPSAGAVDQQQVAERPAVYASADCGRLGAVGGQLQCKYEAALAAHYQALAKGGNNEKQVQAERAYYEFMEAASEHLSRTFSGYNLGLMGVGLVLIAAAAVGIAALYQSSGAGLVHVKSRQLAVSLPAVVMWATYLVSSTSTSLIEEEHQFWYFWVQTLLALRLATGGQWRTLAQMAMFRVVRKWNQTGQFWAGEPDVRQFLGQAANARLLWLLAAATVVLVNLAAWYVHCKYRRPALWSRTFRVLLGYGSVCALVYHIERSHAWTALGTAAQLRWIVRLCVPGDLAHIARTVYLLTALQAAASCAGLRRSRPHLAPLDALVGIMPLLLLLSRPHNFAVFGLFLGIFTLFFPAHASDTQWAGRLRPSRALVLFALAHASFFALGNSNSLASIDLSNAYAGVSRYSEVLVGVLVFISSWAGPLWWAIAGLSAVALELEHDRSVTQLLARVRALLTAAHLWQASTLLAISWIATAMRMHLFVWSVFSPRYLYQIAWFIGFYLGCGTVGGLLWLAAIVRLGA